MPIDPQTITVQGTPPSDVPTQPNPDLPQGLSDGLQSPGGITVPGTNMNVAQPQAPPAPSPQHALGHTLGRVFSSLSGGHTEYTIDPQTGTTVPTQVKDPPGQTFRSILALGLMGGQGIGPKEGQNTFTQGLLAGLGGGVRESTERKDMLDKQRREQAQQQYANQLRAAQEEREKKKLTMDEQLNQVAIADHNQNIAYRSVLMKNEAEDRARKLGVDAAQPFIQNSQIQVEADAPKVQGYKELGIDPLASGLTASELQKYVSDHPGATTQQMGLHTGTRSVYDPATGKMNVEDLYSVYPAMNKVPPSLLQELKSDGADKPGSTLHSAYMELNANKGGNVDARKLLPVFRDMTNWETLQKSSLDRRLKEAEIFRDYQSGAAESVRLQLEKLGLKEKTDQMAAEKLFRESYDVTTQNLRPDAMLRLDPNAVDPNTKQPLYKTPQQKAKVLADRELLYQALTANYEQTNKDFYDHYKPTKDAFGNYVVDDTQAAPMMGYMQGLRSATDQLAGRVNPANVAAATNGLDPQTADKVNKTIGYFKGQNINDPHVVQDQLTQQKIPPVLQQAIFKGLGLTQPPPRDSLSPMGRDLVNKAKEISTSPLGQAVTGIPIP